MKKLLLSLILCLSASFAFAQEPALEWRGIMIDVSRHFLPIEYLYKEVDAMEHFGLNKLHIHFTDDAGWRIEIKSRPRLTDIGAWRCAQTWKGWRDGNCAYSDSQNGFGGFYTQEELRQLVAYAKNKGIDIIPEIEFPAHSREVVAAYPEVGFNQGEMDMKKDETFVLMRDVLTEVADIFPSEYIHVGGDEAATQHDVQPEAMRRIRDIVRSLGRKMVVWDEALTDNPADNDMVIMVWRNIDIARTALERGYSVVLCPGKYCYLDKAQDAPMEEPKCAGGYLPVDSVYMLPDPAKGIENKGRILGVQANVWTEHIETPEYCEYMIWPRAFAIAEIGREGLTDKRDVKAFHQRAVEASDYLRNTLHINAFDLHKEKGERYFAPDKKALPYTITYNTHAHKAYPGSGDLTLCDNVYGGWNNNDGRWQGFIGAGGMDVTLDLGKMKKVSSIAIDVLQSTGPEIFFPYTMEISVSSDGRNFTTMSTKTFDEFYARKAEDYQQFTWTGKAKTRYLRIKALPGEKQGWIFCSEIEVK